MSIKFDQTIFAGCWIEDALWNRAHNNFDECLNHFSSKIRLQPLKNNRPSGQYKYLKIGRFLSSHTLQTIRIRNWNWNSCRSSWMPSGTNTVLDVETRAHIQLDITIVKWQTNTCTNSTCTNHRLCRGIRTTNTKLFEFRLNYFFIFNFLIFSQVFLLFFLFFSWKVLVYLFTGKIKTENKTFKTYYMLAANEMGLKPVYLVKLIYT